MIGLAQMIDSDLHDIASRVKEIDPAYFIVGGFIPYPNAYNMLADYIEYMHIKDAIYKTGEVVPSGMGDGCIKEIITRLKNKNWSGFLSLEPHLGDFVGFSELEQQYDTEKKELSDANKFALAFNALWEIVEK